MFNKSPYEPDPLVLNAVPGYWEDMTEEFKTMLFFGRLTINPQYGIQAYPLLGTAPDMALPNIIGNFFYSRTVRFSSFRGGDGGEKTGNVNFAIYTDKTKEETIHSLNAVLEEIQPQLDVLKLTTEGFILTTKFFRYGETKKYSKEAEIFADAISQVIGVYPDASGSCLSDLSIFLNFGNKNSFNYGIPRGSKDGGGAHQPNEHIECEKLVNCTKALALFLLRG